MAMLKVDPAVREAFGKRRLKVQDAYKAMAGSRGRPADGVADLLSVPKRGAGGRPGLGEAFGVEMGKAFDAVGAGQ